MVLTEVEKIVLVSVTVFMVVSVTFFTAGYLCRHYVHCHKEKHHLAESTLPPTQAENPHEAIQQEHCVHVQALELNTNAAYENVTLN